MTSQNFSLRAIGSTLNRGLRNFTFLVSTIPTLFLFFAFVTIGLSSGLAIPFAIPLFIVMLSVMEQVARLEIKRANKILGTDFEVPTSWFSEPLLSWEGAKQRITSVRSWMTVLYVIIGFGVSIGSLIALSITLLTFFLAFFWMTESISGWLPHVVNFDFTDGADSIHGSLSIGKRELVTRFMLGDSSDSFTWNANFTMIWVLVFMAVLTLISLWSVSRITHFMVKLIDQLLSGGAREEFELAVGEVQQSLQKKFPSAFGEQEESGAQASVGLSQLTKRENEVLALIAQGKSNAGIARELFITVASVEKFVSKIMEKLQLEIDVDSHRRVLAALAYIEASKTD